MSAQLGNISEKGMFVISEITYPASTEFNFRVDNPDPRLAVTGRGQVAWRRQLSSGELRPAGMGCEILRLTDESQESLEQRLTALSSQELVRSPPDRRSLTQEMSRHDIHESLSKQQLRRPEYFRTMGGKTPSPQKSRVSWPFWIVSGLLLLTVTAIGLHRSGLISPAGSPAHARPALEATSQEASIPPRSALQRTGAPQTQNRSEETNPRMSQETTDSSGGPGRSSGGPGRSSGGPIEPSGSGERNTSATKATKATKADDREILEAASATSALASTLGVTNKPAVEVSSETGSLLRTEALSTVQAWASSWTQQSVDDYLQFYARDFQPSSGRSKTAWTIQRRERLTSPRFIEVSLERVVFSGGRSKATMTFQQTYRSDSLQDRVEKTLELVREDNRWKILSENAKTL